MKKVLGFTLCFIFIFSLPVFISLDTSAKNSDYEIDLDFSDKAKSVYLYSYDANRVLFAQGEDEMLSPASTAKMMAGLVVCEKFSDKLDKEITVTDDMLAGHSGASMNLKSGMSLTVRDLLYGTVCGGNNDAALALAFTCSGSISEFVDEMNKYARLLDMRDTKYSNPTGLDSKNAFTTLTDTVKLARKAADNDLYLKISSTSSYAIEGQDITVYNRNALISQFSAQGYLNKSAKGLIAGNTDEGGYVLSTVAEKDGARLLCVVMGASADSEDIHSYTLANDLFDYAFNRYSFKKVAEAGEVLEKLDVSLALTSKDGAKVSCAVAEDVYAFLPYDISVDKLTFKTYFYDENISAPVEANSILGGVDIYYGDIFITNCALIAKENVEPNFLLRLLENMKSFFLGRVFWITLIFAVPSIAVYLYASRRTRRKKVSTVQFKKFY